MPCGRAGLCRAQTFPVRRVLARIRVRGNEMQRTALSVLVSGSAIALAGGVLARWRQRRRRFSLRGRVALVTGGVRGLGFAIAEELLTAGSRVALCARSPEACAAASRKLALRGEVFAYPCDLTQPDQIPPLLRAIADHWAPVDVLINNAGIMLVGPAEQMNEADFRAALDIHFWAPLRLIQTVIPHMRAQRAGRIVNISSIGGIVPVPHMLPYTASKFALTGLSQGLSSELATADIRVTTVCPWLTRTGSQEGAQFKGRYRQEFTWFAALGTAPIVPQSAAAAARRIVRALRRGEARVVLGWQGRLAAAAYGWAPSAMLGLLGLAARWLPAPAPQNSALRAGAASYSRWTALWLRPRISRDQARYNQPAA